MLKLFATHLLKKRWDAWVERQNFTVVKEVLHNNQWSRNLIGPYHILAISPGSSTSFTRPFLARRCTWGWAQDDCVPSMEANYISWLVYVVLSQGFCKMAIALRKLGLLSEETHQRLQPDAASLRWVGVAISYPYSHLPPSINFLLSFLSLPSFLSFVLPSLPPFLLPLPSFSPPSISFLSLPSFILPFSPPSERPASYANLSDRHFPARPHIQCIRSCRKRWCHHESHQTVCRHYLLMLSLYLHNQLADLTREEGSREGRKEGGKKEGRGRERREGHLPFFSPPISSYILRSPLFF